MGISAYNVYMHIDIHIHIYMRTNVHVHVEKKATTGKLGDEEGHNSGKGHMSHQRRYE